jgi:YebC/PmpR family DNA-binding regulatory protein
MSGHSKWSTIKHDKGVNDAKRGKVFSRLAKLISIAVKETGIDDPESNPKLRMYMDKARAANMPKENIQRAIDKGAGRVEGANYEEIMYEGFGPSKVAFIVSCLTDNRNRTNSEMKILFDKNGGVLGSSGSTGYFFDRKGVVEVSIPEGKNRDDFELELIDFGAEDIKDSGNGSLQLVVDASTTHATAEKIKSAGIEVLDATVAMVPNTYIDLAEGEYNKLSHFLEVVDDYEDVQEVFHNGKKA